MLIAPGMAYRRGNSKHGLFQWEIRRQGNHNSHSSIASLKLHLIVHIFPQLHHTAKSEFVALHYREAPVLSRTSGTSCDLEPALNLNIINLQLSDLGRESEIVRRSRDNDSDLASLREKKNLSRIDDCRRREKPAIGSGEPSVDLIRFSVDVGGHSRRGRRERRRRAPARSAVTRLK